MRFPVYEFLYTLNRNLQEIVSILEQIKRSPGVPRKKFDAYQVEIQYLRSEATQDVLEIMNDAELDEAAKLDRKRRAYTDSIRDLDDVYFEVQDREDERRKQGLPPLIGVLPRKSEGLWSTDEREREEEEPVDSRTFKVASRSQEQSGARSHKSRRESKEKPQRKRQSNRHHDGTKDRRGPSASLL